VAVAAVVAVLILAYLRVQVGLEAEVMEEELQALLTLAEVVAAGH
jgi:hypothetical protein